MNLMQLGFYIGVTFSFKKQIMKCRVAVAFIPFFQEPIFSVEKDLCFLGVQKPIECMVITWMSSGT